MVLRYMYASRRMTCSVLNTTERWNTAEVIEGSEEVGQCVQLADGADQFAVHDRSP